MAAAAAAVTRGVRRSIVPHPFLFLLLVTYSSTHYLQGPYFPHTSLFEKNIHDLVNGGRMALAQAHAVASGWGRPLFLFLP